MFASPARTAAAAAGLLLLVAGECRAICLPEPHYRYVGDTASDAKCTDDDIQSAIDNATCPGTTIVITRERAYSGLHLNIDSKSLALVGVGAGVACGSQPQLCGADSGCGGSGPPPAPAVTLTGDGGASVVYIHGSSTVTLQSLELTGGGGTDYGGGVHFSGSGALTLVDTTIDGNAALYGGGIQFQGTGGGFDNYTATLTLGAGTMITGNSAGFHGGGIEITDSARLFALAPYTQIIGNDAPNGRGGGVHVLGPARADIASPGYDGAPVIAFNRAAYGGGIAVDANTNSNDDAIVRLFTVDPQHPVWIANNVASHTGGGVYLHPDAGSISLAKLCAFDFRIDYNVAQEGAGVYADEDYTAAYDEYVGSELIVNTDPFPQSTDSCSKPETPAALGAVACAPGVACSTFDGNVAEDSNGNPTPGAAILVQTEGEFDANRFEVRGNQGAHAIRVIDPIVDSTVTNCLLGDNLLTAELVYVQNDGTSSNTTSYRNCTIADNTIGGSVFYAGRPLQVFDSIIDESANPAVSAGGGVALAFGDLLVANGGGLPAQADIVFGTPKFVDAAAGNYDLLPSSPGVDFAPAGDAGNPDLDEDIERRPRDIDLPDIANVYGPRDLGAYERQSELACDDSANAIFCSGFE